jgi:hypothetical protein
MFCAGPETFTLIYKSCTFFYFAKAADFHSPRGIEREMGARSNRARVLSRGVAAIELGRNDFVSVIIRRHNFTTMRP